MIEFTNSHMDEFGVRAEINNKISLWKGDITTMEIEAIVNAGKFCHVEPDHFCYT